MMFRVIANESIPERGSACDKRNITGFTLTEMLVTTLILTLAATLMATGIPAAIDTYHKMVRVSNAQMALSTTLGVVRSELGLATNVLVDTDDNKVFYYSAGNNAGTGCWCSISNPPEEEDGAIKIRGLVKQVYKGTAHTMAEVKDLEPFNEGEPLVANEAITSELLVRFVEGGIIRPNNDNSAVYIKIYVRDIADAQLAQVGMGDEYGANGYRILTRFVS